MKKNISSTALNIIKKMQQNELTESYIYAEIAKFAKGDENKKTLLRLSEEEKAHYEIWKKYTEIEMKPQKGKVFKYKLLARIFGFTFAVKLMEKGESGAQKEYHLLAQEVEESNFIREQEEEHEHALLDMLDEYWFIKVVGNHPGNEYVGIVSCLIDGMSSDSAGTIFDKAGVAVRTGLQCAPLAHEFMKTYPAGTIRLSTSYFTTEEDFKALANVLDYIEENL